MSYSDRNRSFRSAPSTPTRMKRPLSARVRSRSTDCFRSRDTDTAQCRSASSDKTLYCGIRRFEMSPAQPMACLSSPDRQGSPTYHCPIVAVAETRVGAGHIDLLTKHPVEIEYRPRTHPGPRPYSTRSSPFAASEQVLLRQADPARQGLARKRKPEDRLRTPRILRAHDHHETVVTSGSVDRHVRNRSNESQIAFSFRQLRWNRVYFLVGTAVPFRTTRLACLEANVVHEPEHARCC